MLIVKQIGVHTAAGFLVEPRYPARRFTQRSTLSASNATVSPTSHFVDCLLLDDENVAERDEVRMLDSRRQEL